MQRTIYQIRIDQCVLKITCHQGRQHLQNRASFPCHLSPFHILNMKERRKHACGVSGEIEFSYSPFLLSPSQLLGFPTGIYYVIYMELKNIGGGMIELTAGAGTALTIYTGKKKVYPLHQNKCSRSWIFRYKIWNYMQARRKLSCTDWCRGAVTVTKQPHTGVDVTSGCLRAGQGLVAVAAVIAEGRWQRWSFLCTAGPILL